MKRLVLKTAAALLRLAYCPFRLARPKRKVTMISRQGDTPSEDLLLLREELQKRRPPIEIRLLCKSIPEGLAGKVGYVFHMLTQMRHIASSRVVLLDGYCIAASVLNHRSEITIVQMWHALAAIKKFGYQTIGKPAGHSADTAEILCMHRNYDYVLAPSEATGAIFQETFRVPPETIRYIGLPRIDRITRGAVTDSEAVRSRYQIPGEKKMVLYVPTFRKDRPADWPALAAALDPDRTVLILKLHPLDTLSRQLADPRETDGARVILGDEHTTWEWLDACDSIITDYSALGVEAALTGKPLYFYVYDIEEYRREVGLNVDPEKELPACTARDPRGMAELLERPYDAEQLAAFRKKYVSVPAGSCTRQLADFVEELIDR